MSQNNSGNPSGRRRRTLDISRIKVVIVVISAAVVGLLSSLAGLGAHLAYTPALEWMLGFKTEKAHATAMRYALAASLTTVIGYAVGHYVVLYLMYYGLLLFAGATVGALFSAQLVKTSPDSPSRSVFQALAMFLCVFIIVRTVRMTAFDLPYYFHWTGGIRLVAAGAVIGALSQLTGITTGVLLYPCLHYLFGLTAHDTVITALIVVVLAAILPTWSYGKQGLIDAQYGGTALVGGIIGGIITFTIIPNISDKYLLIIFSLLSMFLCAREIARLSINSRHSKNNLQN